MTRKATRIGVPPAPPNASSAFAAALAGLDPVLKAAIDDHARDPNSDSLIDPWRVTPLDTRRLMKPLLSVPRLARAANAFSLTQLDLAILLIVIAPDLDLRYARIYAYLQDDIQRRRPTSDVVVDLLARGGPERLDICARLLPDAPLMRSNILVADDARPGSRLAQAWRVDEMWSRYFFDQSITDDLLEGEARFFTVSRAPRPVVLTPEGVAALGDGVNARSLPARLLLTGPHGAGKFAFAQAFAQSRNARLLIIDLRDVATASAVRRVLATADRAAVLGSAVLFLHGATRLEQRDPHLWRAVSDALPTLSAPVVLASTSAFGSVHGDPTPFVRVALEFPDAAQRRVLWTRMLGEHGLTADTAQLERVAGRFSLSAAQIDQAVAEVAARTAADETTVTAVQMAAAAREQSGAELARLAKRITPKAALETIVAPPEVLDQLREMCARVGTRDRVRHEWADNSVHARANGITALFVGPSGTGKTLSAEAVAQELGLDLYRIDLSSVVSKYIGETEKNLDAVFTAAEHANAVLFFDEADALFGKRSEVKDAHDRYANLEVAYLLQKMEQFDGLAILATNLKQNLDEAFARRLTFTVIFPFPEESERRRLWESLWPQRAPKADDVDFAWFAHEYRLSGGNIRNAVLAAAHLAAANGQAVTRDHLLHATRREFQKLGKNLPPVSPRAVL